MTTSSTTITTDRLDLVALTAPAIEALLAGDTATASALVRVELPLDLGSRANALLVLRLRDLRANPGAESWFLRVIALRDAVRPMIGLTGCHGPPDLAGTVEVGYEVLPGYRLRGYASEAASAIAAWALSDGGAQRVVAAIRPDNEASLRVIARAGFSACGSRWDAIDGTSLLFERRRPGSPAPDRGGDGKMPDEPGAAPPRGPSRRPDR